MPRILVDTLKPFFSPEAVAIIGASGPEQVAGNVAAARARRPMVMKPSP